LTTTLEALTTRSWPILIDTNIVGFPNSLSPDTNLGPRMYSARLAYEYMNRNLPGKVITQNNPTPILDRPSGLYGERQMVIADRTAYGVPMDALETLRREIGVLFGSETVSWKEIDQTCQKYQIDVLIINDTDPIWKSLSSLAGQHSPLYQNEFYAALPCGRFAKD
jgi:hypothetical protein